VSQHAFKRGTPFWLRFEPGPGGCWLWKGARRHGYGAVNVDGFIMQSHRRAWELAFGPIPEGMLVLHHCDNRACGRPTHLFLGTQADNIADMDTKGRRVNAPHPGETNGSHKMTAQQVRDIRARYTGEKGQIMALSKEYGLSFPAMRQIIRRLSWRSV